MHNLMTAQEAAVRMSVSPALIWKLCRQGLLVPWVRLSPRTLRIEKTEVERFLWNHRVGAPFLTNRLWTAAEIAREMRVSTSFVWRQAREGQIPHWRITDYCLRFPDPTEKQEEDRVVD